jgi:pyroglutamyl-peptidase
MRRTVLVTGFDDYGEETDNPSGALARRVDDRTVDGVRIHGCVLPVASQRVQSALTEAIRQVEPAVVIVTGIAPGRFAPAMERVAVNVLDFPIPDVDQHAPIDERVVVDGPSAYLSTLPVKAILARWLVEEIPGYVSNTAGTFVCNQTFYLARHLLAGTSVTAGLLHIPATPKRAVATAAPMPSMALELLERAVLSAAVVAATHEGPDLRLRAGAFS